MAPFEHLAETSPPSWINALWNVLLAYNPLVGGLFHLSILNAQFCPNAHITHEDTGTATEIAAIMNYENTTRSVVRAWIIIVICWDEANQSISTISYFWEPLAYSLLFPHKTLGWGIYRTHDDLGVCYILEFGTLLLIFLLIYGYDFILYHIIAYLCSRS